MNISGIKLKQSRLLATEIFGLKNACIVRREDSGKREIIRIGKEDAWT
jgi:hypothetical protein